MAWMTVLRARLLAGALVSAVVLVFSVPALAQTHAPPPPIEFGSASPNVTQPVTVKNLFTETISDFKNWPSRETFLWLGVGTSAALIGHTEDSSVTSFFSASRGLHETLEPGAVIGGTPFQLGAAIATYTVGRFANSPRVARIGADLIQAQIVAEATTIGLKYAFGRTRPDATPRSFPSGHAAVTFASATV